MRRGEAEKRRKRKEKRNIHLIIIHHSSFIIALTPGPHKTFAQKKIEKMLMPKQI
jgi:uncharacterized protein Veg